MNVVLDMVVLDLISCVYCSFFVKKHKYWKLSTSTDCFLFILIYGVNCCYFIVNNLIFKIYFPSILRVNMVNKTNNITVVIFSVI